MLRARARHESTPSIASLLSTPAPPPTVARPSGLAALARVAALRRFRPSARSSLWSSVCNRRVWLTLRTQAVGPWAQVRWRAGSDALHLKCLKDSAAQRSCRPTVRLRPCARSLCTPMQRTPPMLHATHGGLCVCALNAPAAFGPSAVSAERWGCGLFVAALGLAGTVPICLVCLSVGSAGYSPAVHCRRAARRAQAGDAAGAHHVVRKGACCVDARAPLHGVDRADVGYGECASQRTTRACRARCNMRPVVEQCNVASSQ